MNEFADKEFEFVVCIPARYASTRLPGKPLIELKGKALVLWAAEAAAQLGAKEVVVATDDERILAVVQQHGHQAVMTRQDHATGTDRIAECAELMGWDDDTWVLNYQGDEPNIPKANVQQVIQVVQANPRASIGTLYQPVQSTADLFNPNVVKLVTNEQQEAMYFSRAPIPWVQAEFNSLDPQSNQLPTAVSFKHHIGLYMYKVNFLRQFSQAPMAALEQAESLEQLRALAMGKVIVAAAAVAPMPHGIDTAADVARFENN
ncbi:3-deoxy-manno-octulosonate cytidylyltransferase [Marinicella meishanensis]|uniref:3-deoxy-manno-octulosonate cytidylyltransferase n=1 Tax=Marinicella meishanensis TaxID=2873263 RepID=UPI001CBFD8E7|nr:3-deoxy-manno-octulosonate cytidylyltransferase [Marinicella sp. NBU2979]